VNRLLWHHALPFAVPRQARCHGNVEENGLDLGALLARQFDPGLSPAPLDVGGVKDRDRRSAGQALAQQVAHGSEHPLVDALVRDLIAQQCADCVRRERCERLRRRPG
jgi:hypothetical protein